MKIRIGSQEFYTMPITHKPVTQQENTHLYDTAYLQA